MKRNPFVLYAAVFVVQGSDPRDAKGELVTDGNGILMADTNRADLLDRINSLYHSTRFKIVRFSRPKPAKRNGGAGRSTR